MVNFVWENIVCRFGIPHEIISDNGTQFAADPFKSWCSELSIKQTFTSVAHPQANGQVEVTNRDIVAGIKARLGTSRTGWVEELPNVLWAHRTMPKNNSTWVTPFSLVYGTEAVIPAEISVPTQRVLTFEEEANMVSLQENLNMAEEVREMAAIQEARNKHKMAKYYNRKVQSQAYKTGDYVWRKNEASRAEDTGKLGLNWEGPYQVTEVHGNGAYSLACLDGTAVPRTWHATNLKRCYV